MGDFLHREGGMLHWNRKLFAEYLYFHFRFRINLKYLVLIKFNKSWMQCNFAKLYELNNYFKLFSRLLTTAEDIESKSLNIYAIKLCNGERSLWFYICSTKKYALLRRHYYSTLGPNIRMHITNWTLRTHRENTYWGNNYRINIEDKHWGYSTKTQIQTSAFRTHIKYTFW